MRACVRRTLVFALGLVLLPAAAPPGGAAAQEIRAATDHIDIAQEPKGPLNLVSECLRNRSCLGVVEAAATYVGVPPGTVTALGAAVEVTHQPGSEEQTLTYYLPEGYVLCDVGYHRHAFIGVGSFGVTLYRRQVDVYIWLQRRSMFQGRSVANVELTIAAVRREARGRRVRDGTCRQDNHQVVLLNHRWG